MGRDGEPTVEDILASIKKVIASDNRAGRRAAPPTDPVDDDEAEDVLDLGEAGEFVADGESDGERLVREEAVDSMRESLAALSMMSAPRARPQVVRQGETSIEGLVREMLRPMLAEWLDDNLPALVERLVAEEIRRISGKKA